MEPVSDILLVMGHRPRQRFFAAASVFSDLNMSLSKITIADVRQPTTSTCFSLLLRSRLVGPIAHAGTGVARKLE